MICLMRVRLFIAELLAAKLNWFVTCAENQPTDW
jgi:hypothetical protein